MWFAGKIMKKICLKKLPVSSQAFKYSSWRDWLSAPLQILLNFSHIFSLVFLISCGIWCSFSAVDTYSSMRKASSLYVSWSGLSLSDVWPFYYFPLWKILIPYEKDHWMLGKMLTAWTTQSTGYWCHRQQHGPLTPSFCIFSPHSPKLCFSHTLLV